MAFQTEQLPIIKIISYFLLIIRSSNGLDVCNNFRYFNRIVGGISISIEKAPYHAQVLMLGRTICGASIISPRYLLSAAHCFPFGSRYKPNIRVGSNTIDGGIIVYTERVIIHPEYKAVETDSDIAVMKLTTELEFTNKVKPIELPDRSWENYIGEKAMVVGFGKTDMCENVSDVLLSVDLPIISLSKCREVFDDQVTDRMFCAGFVDGGKDACMGDSGGALVFNHKQYGIVSWGRGCGLPEVPGIYTDVYLFLDWIKKQMDQ